MKRSVCLSVVVAAIVSGACQSARVEEEAAGVQRSELTAEQCDYFEVGGTTRICHATGSSRNPYVLISVSRQACVAAHAAHARDYVAVDNPPCSGQGCLPAGAPCDPTVPCCEGFECRAGACAPTDLCVGVTCSPSDQCHAASCDPATGACRNEPKVDGFPCNDGNACTTQDTCQAGACAGASPVVCPPADACHAAGSCDPGTGACSQPALPDGTACSDGDPRTVRDACTGGVCAGVAPPPPFVVASTTEPGTAYVFQGDGTSIPVTPVGQVVGTSGPHFPSRYSVWAGDLDGDGYADAFLGDSYGSRGHVFRGGASGLIAPPASTMTAFGLGRAATVGDFDGDGVTELAVVNDSTLFVYERTAGAIFGTTATTTYPVLAGNVFAVVASADIDGDGFADIVAGRGGASGVTIYRGGAAGLTPIDLPSPDNSGYFGLRLVTGDFNGDGRGDFVVGGTYLGKLWAYHGGASIPTTHAAVVQIPSGQVGDSSLMATIGDFNGDGYEDLAVATQDRTTSPSTHRVHVFAGSAAGLVATPFMTIERPLEGPDPIFQMVEGIGDQDGDGRAELAFGYTLRSGALAETRVEVYRGRATGGLVTAPDVTIPRPSNLVTLADRTYWGGAIIGRRR